jgi:hypothetical protein
MLVISTGAGRSAEAMYAAVAEKLKSLPRPNLTYRITSRMRAVSSSPSLYLSNRV